MDQSIVITGLEDVQRSLSELPRAIVRDLFPDALAAGAAVIEGELDSRTPEAVQSTSGKQYGSLRSDLASTVKVDAQALEGNARIGFGAKGFVARMVEYGHREVTHAGKDVGNTAPHPFMRVAADTSEEAAIDAFVDSLIDNIS